MRPSRIRSLAGSRIIVVAPRVPGGPTALVDLPTRRHGAVNDRVGTVSLGAEELMVIASEPSVVRLIFHHGEELPDAANPSVQVRLGQMLHVDPQPTRSAPAASTRDAHIARAQASLKSIYPSTNFVSREIIFEIGLSVRFDTAQGAEEDLDVAEL